MPLLLAFKGFLPYKSLMTYTEKEMEQSRVEWKVLENKDQSTGQDSCSETRNGSNINGLFSKRKEKIESTESSDQLLTSQVL